MHKLTFTLDYPKELYSNTDDDYTAGLEIIELLQSNQLTELIQLCESYSWYITRGCHINTVRMNIEFELTESNYTYTLLKYPFNRTREELYD
jgi:hypothetical protein